MTSPATSSPRWASHVSHWRAVGYGLSDCRSVAGLILFGSAAGFGALARDAGFSIENALVMMAAFYALPAQVVLVDEMARGGSLLAGAAIIFLTAIRLLPMVVSIMPQIAAPKARRWEQVVAVHGVAVTGWLEGMRRLPEVPEEHRLSYYAGLSWGLISLTVLGTAAGFLASGSVPPVIAAGLLFLTPVYFFVSLLATALHLEDFVAIASGAVLGPVTFVLLPGFDLLVAAIGGGGLAWFVGQRRKTRQREAGNREADKREADKREAPGGR